MTDESRVVASPFSPDYKTARARFLAAAASRGFRLESIAVGLTGPSGEDLTIDAAVLGADQPERVVIVSSGLHGVEGFFGSAVQLGMLEAERPGRPPGPNDALVVLHALNPYGFAWVRRFDEGNVDLNRNMLVDGQAYRGSPPRYAALDGLLNPERPPSPFDLFPALAVLAVLRFGMTDLKSAIAGGQYDYPRGVFFGGNGPSQLQAILSRNLPRWLGRARSALHLDFHTGLGRWGTYRLLLEPKVNPARVASVARTFGADRIDLSDPSGVSYPTRGDIGTWCRSTFPGCDYDYICAEFGTYSPIRVLSALRAENRAHHWLSAASPARLRAKRRLLEAFVPADPAWRKTTVSQALDLIGLARDAVFEA
ncbi:MAG: M14 family metallopeptidase [Planctomycetia bacterium]|nr:M14 family metallopeptidase [Planctomycetia bacterium]